MEQHADYQPDIFSEVNTEGTKVQTTDCADYPLKKQEKKKWQQRMAGKTEEIAYFCTKIHRLMSVIQIKDKKFAVSIPEETILKEVSRVAAEINRDLAGKNPLFLSVLNGSFMFTADLMKRINIPCEISFVKLASYQGVASTGKVKEVIGITEDLTDRTIVIVEDIVDTGLTMQRLLETLGTRRPKEIHIATLLLKPEKLKVDLDIEYVAMQIPNDFIVGYGLDYDGLGRNYKDIYTVVND